MNTPERDPSAGAGSMDGNHCYTWKKGEGSGGGSTVGGGKFCPAMAEVTPLGPGRFSAPSKRGAGVQVGDQFLSMVWKGFTYTIANSSAVTTQDVGVHAGGYMVSHSTTQHDLDMEFEVALVLDHRPWRRWTAKAPTCTATCRSCREPLSHS